MFQYAALMVGPPKTLQDLRKVDGAIRITCQACKRVEVLDREETIMLRYRRSCDWAVFVSEAKCPDCLSADVKVAIDAFGENLPEVRARRNATHCMNLALQVLNEAARRNNAVPPAAIRLALRVLYPFLGDQRLLVEYWEHVSVESDRPWGGAHQVVRWMVTRLLERQWSVWAEFR